MAYKFQEEMKNGRNWANKIARQTIIKYNNRANKVLDKISYSCLDYSAKGRKGNKKLSQSEIDFYAGAFLELYDISKNIKK